jgi:hypothetical protein
MLCAVTRQVCHLRGVSNKRDVDHEPYDYHENIYPGER